MKQRVFSPAIIIVSTMIMLTSIYFNCSPASKTKRPNILFIAVDDLRPELGCYGETYVISPNIDRIAQSGIVFNQAFCQSAVCNPSRASLLTGLRPDSIRVWDLRTDFRDIVPDVVTLPQYFKNNGYHTAAIGKIYHNTIPDPLSWSESKLHITGYPFDPDAVYRDPEIIEELEKRKKEITAAGNASRHIDRLGEWYLKATATECVDLPDEAYYDGAQTDLALRKLDSLASGEKPFFFAIGYYRPHLPFNAPKKYWDMYDRSKVPLAENDYMPENAPLMAINNLRELRGYSDFRHVLHPAEGKLSEAEARLLKHGYLASVTYIDAQIGKLLDGLDRMGLMGNTIIVLWGDHGWKLGEHNSWCKMTNYEIDTRVPLIISAPALKSKHILCNGMVEFVDIYPTLCDLAGLQIPDRLEGISMVPLMQSPELPWKKAVFSQFLREGIWMAPDGIPYMGYSIRTERYRYVKWVNWMTGKPVAEELYDHALDPDENFNLAVQPEYRILLNDMSDRMAAGWMAALPD